jgi:hypothetical protein
MYKYGAIVGLCIGFMFFTIFSNYALGYWFGAKLISEKYWNDITG